MHRKKVSNFDGLRQRLFCFGINCENCVFLDLQQNSQSVETFKLPSILQDQKQSKSSYLKPLHLLPSMPIQQRILMGGHSALKVWDYLPKRYQQVSYLFS